jgi:hypothetical protein
VERDRASTAALLTGVLGFTDFGEEDGWHRYVSKAVDPAAHEIREMPNEARNVGVGAMITSPGAWRTMRRARVRERVAAAQRPTDITTAFGSSRSTPRAGRRCSDATDARASLPTNR